MGYRSSLLSHYGTEDLHLHCKILRMYVKAVCCRDRIWAPRNIIFGDDFAPLPSSLHTAISNIQLANYPDLMGLSRCLLAFLATIVVLTTKAHTRKNEIFLGHTTLALNHKTGWRDSLSCAFADSLEIR